MSTTFCLAQFLGCDRTTLTAVPDNATGHGNYKQQARIAERELSRQQSQLYMCRKPRRSVEQQDESSSVMSKMSACSLHTTTATAAPLSPPTISLKSSLALCRTSSPQSVTLFFDSSSSSSSSCPLLSSPLLHASSAESKHRRNSHKPVRHESVRDLNKQPQQQQQQKRSNVVQMLSNIDFEEFEQQ